MQLNIPPNTESVEITIIEETPQSNWIFRCFRVHGETVLIVFIVVAFVICVSICIYLIVVDENDVTETIRITVQTTEATTMTLLTTTKSGIDGVWNPL